MDTVQASADDLPADAGNKTDEQEDKNEKIDDEQEVHRFEGKVSAEQELSASVARRRRNISKKKSESAHRPRDLTPARELLSDKPITDEEDAPRTPERKIKKSGSSNNNKENGTGAPNEKTEKVEIQENGETVKVSTSEVQEKEEVKIKTEKEEMDSDLQSLMSKAKRSASIVPREKPARMKRDKNLKKRSSSTPRPAEGSGNKDDLEEQKKLLKQDQGDEIVVSETKIQIIHRNKEEPQIEKRVKTEKVVQTVIREVHVEKETTQTQSGIDLVEDFKQAQILTSTPEPIKELPVSSSNSSIESSESDEKSEIKKEFSPGAQMYLERLRQEKSLSTDEPPPESEKSKKPSRMTFKELHAYWRQFKSEHPEECERVRSMRNRCLNDLGLLMIFCGIGGIIFKFTEGAFENFYKCGVKRVKRDFIDLLWQGSHNLREEDWKTLARSKLREFEEQLHTAHEAGVQSYSGQRSWSFLNGIVYALTVVTTIGYGHMYPTTTTGRALTIVYALIGIPLFLIILTDFGKLFTRAIKFVWAFVRRLYYTGTCKQARKTTAMKEVMKGAQMVYDIATFRRPSTYHLSGAAQEQPPEFPSAAHNHSAVGTPHTDLEAPDTPAPSNFEIDDEFNLPITVALIILILYIFSGAVVYYYWEEWDFFASFYFVFISMSTIGFGDYVPRHPICMIVSIIYLVFGLALMSMCINVVQVKLSDTFRQASAKLGATIGLRVAEEDGSITTIPPPAVEIASIHSSNAKQV